MKKFSGAANNSPLYRTQKPWHDLPRGVLDFGVAFFILSLVAFFFTPQQYVPITLGEYFWISLALFSAFFTLSIYMRELVVSFYFVFWIFFGFFGYTTSRLFGSNFFIDFTVEFPLLACLLLGAHGIFIILGVQFSRHFLRNVHAKPPITSIRVSYVILIFFFFFFLGIAILFVGFDFFFAGRNDLFLQGDSVGSVRRFVLLVAKLFPYVFLGMLIRGVRAKKISWIFFGLLLVLSFMISNPTNTPRFISLSGVLYLFVCWTLSFSMIRSLFSIVIFFPFIMILALPFTSVMRHGLDGLESFVFSAFFSTGEFSALQILVDGVIVNSSVDITSGFETLSGFLILVPTELFPAKSNGLGPLIANQTSQDFLNFAAPSVLSPFFDLGLVGVCIFSFLVGIIFSRANVWIRLGSRHLNQLGIAILCLVPIFARGDWLTAMLSLYAFIFCIFMVGFTSRLHLKLDQY